MPLKISLAYPAAIPVRHHVELTWLLKPSGLRGKLKPQEAQPFLIDLDTGVRYAPEWTVGNHMTFQASRPNDYATEPLPELQVERVLRGVVLSCTIVHVGLGEPYQHTLLEIEPDV